MLNYITRYHMAPLGGYEHKVLMSSFPRSLTINEISNAQIDANDGNEILIESPHVCDRNLTDIDLTDENLHGACLVQALGSCPASGAPWFSAMPPSLGRDRTTTATTMLHFVQLYGFLQPTLSC